MIRKNESGPAMAYCRYMLVMYYVMFIIVIMYQTKIRVLLSAKFSNANYF